MDAATLDSLRAAAAADAAPPAGAVAPAAPAAPPVDPAAEWASAITTVINVAGMAYPALREVWTAEVCANVGAAIVPVAEKYGLGDMDALLKRWPELRLAVVALPPLFVSLKVVQATHRAAEFAAKEPAAPGAPASPAVASTSAPAGDGTLRAA
jgi:hypothetical protein